MTAGPVLDSAKLVANRLNRLACPYAFCGALAVAFYAEPRATKDIDIVIASEADLPAIDAALAEDGWFNASEPIDFPDGIRLHRRLRRVDSHLILLDLLRPPASMDLLSDRVLAEVDHAAAWVISKRALIVMKRLAGRPKDLADLAELEGEP
jgi:hypothetical protein